jgi:AcrR family transcriptional regulator
VLGVTPPEAGPRAVDGRVPGRRGLATRQRLLDHVDEMLAAGSYRDLRVVDVARQAGTSPATFYQYFADVEEAVLALAEEVARGVQETLVPLVEGPRWRGRAGYDAAMAVVDGYLDFWAAHGGVVRVLDLGQTEGDARFRQIRSRLFTRFNEVLADRVTQERTVGDDVDPRATAGAMTSMLAHVADHRYGFESYGIRTADIRTSMARILFTTVTGRTPPAVD